MLTTHAAEASDRLIVMFEVLELTRYKSRDSIYRLQRQAGFPKANKLGRGAQGRIVFRESDVRA